MRQHLDHLLRCLDLGGLAATDVGCGDGGLARLMAEAGATVTGIEIDPARVDQANASSEGNPRFLVGRGESLPLGDGSQDLVCLMFSLHHIDEGAHDGVFAETLRVLKPGGRFHVVEPHPETEEHDVMRALDDETHVRTVSNARLAGLEGEGGFRLVERKDYVSEHRFATVDDFLESVVRSDPGRAHRVPEVRDEIAEKFSRIAKRENGGHVLGLDCSAYHFESLR